MRRTGVWSIVATAVFVCLAAPGPLGASGAAPASQAKPVAKKPGAPAKTSTASKPASKPITANSAPKPTTSKATSPKASSAPTTSRTSYSASAAKARQAKVASARAASRARTVREAPVPRFKLDARGELVPDLRAAAAVIYNPDTQEVLWEENGGVQRSIASITKVMTAIVFLETVPDLEHKVVIERGDVLRASTTYLRTNEVVSVDDLMHLILIASDNAAARVVARISPWGSAGFVARMNEKAAELGLASTRYADPSGLSADNVSSAYDMARLIAFAAGDERISRLMRKASHQVVTSRRRVTIENTNQLVKRADMDVRGGKTGFIARSGYCLATLLRLPDLDQTVAVVVLGARSNTGRFSETRNLFSWLSAKAQDLFGRRQNGPDEQ